MSMQLKLSERLKTVASFLPENALFADIGSDHAYLPCYVCKCDSSSRAIAGEINHGPYQSALATIQNFGLEHAVDARLGNGLQILRDGEVKQIVIAGMGGSLIRDILENGKDKLSLVNRIIAQPNIDERDVRRWMQQHQFHISAEVLMLENGHFYEIIVGDRWKEEKETIILDEKQLLFGPHLLKERSKLFYEKWKSERKKYNRIISDMKNAKKINVEKLSQFEMELNWIEEVLQDG
ncbi:MULTISPECIES: tRNA (adenine(22)-N(1))-methyltransferase TrmK [unclassified Virgibacillus]|uniref:tRNA (adenine(22)-N(1))-methyltransferase n=1 Tax=unclassified Virgibacillus TaxID=2620237 RepID=UPI0024DE8B0E|nr:tRNA (adenine(22)-N(1))-methyltransferase TrmK [Virgibacillus sp. LDC-1]